MRRTAIGLLIAAGCCAASGCATFCSLSDTGMARPRPFSGVRATITDWEGCSEKPWGNDADLMSTLPGKIYFRTVDVPLSLAADTVLLPMMLLCFTMDGEWRHKVGQPSNNLSEERGGTP